ncbi:MAG TPA: nuclear transport factor 2 family protein [Anaerolineales bacterium]|nr:nuclear transport factor 2 family protein [Anaerolineales bacterium]
MSVEQIARDFITKMNDVDAAESYLTPDAVSAGGVLPQPIPAKEAIGMLGALKTAFPDLRFDVQNVTVNGNQATVQAIWSGTNNGPLNMPLPGMPSIPSTGKQVSVKDTYIVTVQGDKVSRIEVDSPSDGGIPAALAQIGVKVPGM